MDFPWHEYSQNFKWQSCDLFVNHFNKVLLRQCTLTFILII